MNVLGIIAEYNPYHNGHLLQLTQCKSLSDADYTIVVLGSDFLQRGEPSMFTKYDRTQMALLAGADLVLEMPGFASCGSAPYFAGGGISLLKHTGITTHLGFGSESGNLKQLYDYVEAKEKLQNQPADYADHNFAKAMAQSLHMDLTASKPNDTLGIEYLFALRAQHANIKPVTIPRLGDAYHADTLSDASYGSGTALRQSILDLYDHKQADVTLDSLEAYMPSSSMEVIKKALNTYRPLTVRDFYPLIRYQLLQCDKPETMFDISADLGNRLSTYRYTLDDADDWVLTLKSKNYTYAHIQRSLTHLLLQQTKFLLDKHMALDQAPYIRILGFRKQAAPLLKALKTHSDLPIITKLADAKKILSANQQLLFDQDIHTARIYKLIQQTKSYVKIKDEIQESPVIL